MPYPSLLILLSLISLFGSLSCNRLSNNYDQISLSCGVSEAKVSEYNFIKIVSNETKTTPQWRGVLVEPDGNSVDLMNTTSGCIMIPKIIAAPNSRLFLRDQLSSNYQEINPRTLKSRGLSSIDVSTLAQPRQAAIVHLNCPRKTVYTNGTFFLEPQTSDRMLFDITRHHQKITDVAGKTVLSNDTILPNTAAQRLDLNKLDLVDGEYILKTENYGVFDKETVASQTECRILLDRKAPKIQAVISQKFVPHQLEAPLPIQQGDYLEFFTGDEPVIINYCLLPIKQKTPPSINECEDAQSIATDRVKLPDAGQWWLSYFATDLAGNKTPKKTIQIHVRQNRDIRRIKNDIISSGYSVENDQKATLDSLSSMIETYDKLESNLDREEALDYINKHLIELAPKIKELARIDLNFEVLDIIGRPDSDFFAIKIKSDQVETIVLDKNLKTIKKYEAEGHIDFLNDKTWYFYEPSSKLLSLYKYGGFEKYISLDMDISPTKMVISKNLKYLAAKNSDRKVIVYDLEKKITILERELTPGSLSFNLRFNEDATYLYTQQSKTIHRYSLTNTDDVAVYKHQSESIIIDIKVHTRENSQDVSLLSIMYTNQSAKGNTGLYGLRWDRLNLSEDNLIDLNENLINTNSEPYYGVLMEQNDDPYNPIVYFFNYYSKYTYEIDLNQKDFKVTRLEIPLPNPDVDNRIASEQLKDQELVKLQSRIYLEQLKANEPYTYDPYPYVYGKKVILISGGERIVVLTDSHLEVRSVYGGLGKFIFSNYFVEINTNLPNKENVSFSNLSPHDLFNKINGNIAIPQAIGSRRYIYIYDRNLKLDSSILLPSFTELKGITWASDDTTLIITLGHLDKSDSIRKYDTKNGILIGEIYQTKSDIRKVFSHKSLKNSFLTIEKADNNQWQVHQIDIFGGVSLFENMLSNTEIEFSGLDANSFCLGTASEIKCYGDNQDDFVTNHLAIGIQSLSSYMPPNRCLTNLCQIFAFDGNLQQFTMFLEDRTSEIKTSFGKIILKPNNIADIFTQDQKPLLSFSNTEIAGSIADKFWYVFSNIGYITVGNFKTKTPIFDLKPGYIAERDLWHIEFNKEHNCVTLLFTDDKKHLDVQTFYLEKEDTLNELREWINAYQMNAKG